ncbi:MAG: zinc ribbon domain-containing protein [Desulfobacterales bacterium]|nr:zinc ribbon domain-containing protein [Desulfobacterales bacterium]
MSLLKQFKICPKCGFEHQSAQSECLRCGVIFGRLHQDDTPHNPKPKGHETFTEDGRVVFYEHEDSTTALFFAGIKGVFLLFLTFWGIKLASLPLIDGGAGNSILHNVNLPFHEAGHIIFSPFGELVGSLGGTLGQLLIPLICLFTLLFKTRDPYGAAVCLWWFGENFIDIAPYTDDARRLTLPLLGGNYGHSSPYGFHDWEFILTETGLIQHDHTIANAFMVLGVLIMGVSIIWGAWSIYTKHIKD